MQRELNGAGALSASEADQLMQRCAGLAKRESVALAVSGGPDSMALAITVKRWSERHQMPSPQAFIVDHALRSESGKEAAEVRQRLQALGIAAEILRWEHAPVASRLHAEARRARYRLLIEACRRHKISTLLFAHQREDQAETILMRFAKGTGLEGLAGIPSQSMMQDMRIVRPFLNVPKERLIATCREAQIAFIEDPSNGLEKFARGRLRRVLPLLAEEGLTVERLVDFGLRAGEVRDALEDYTHDLLTRSSTLDAYGVLHVEKAELLAAPRAIALRALGQSLQAVHMEDYAPPHASLSLLLDALRDEELLVPRTLNGCRVCQNRQSVTIMRELSGIGDVTPIEPGGSVLWDGRWEVTLTAGAGAQGLIQALGNPPHEVLDRLAPDIRHKVPQGRIRAALPALWHNGEIIALPFHNQNDIVRARLVTIWPPLSRI